MCTKYTHMGPDTSWKRKWNTPLLLDKTTRSDSKTNTSLPSHGRTRRRERKTARIPRKRNLASLPWSPDRRVGSGILLSLQRSMTIYTTSSDTTSPTHLLTWIAPSSKTTLFGKIYGVIVITFSLGSYRCVRLRVYTGAWTRLRLGDRTPWSPLSVHSYY